MIKQPRTSFQLEEEMRLKLGPGDYKVTIHQSPTLGWHAMIHGNRQTHIDKLQSKADEAARELSQQFELYP